MFKNTFHKIVVLFLVNFVLFMFAFNQQSFSMNEDEFRKTKAPKQISSLGEKDFWFTTESDFPFEDQNQFKLSMELKVNILSFLEQGDLLRTGGISKRWRQATEKVWKTKTLDLSNRVLTQADYQAIAQGPFYLLNLQSIRLGTDEIDILISSSRLMSLDWCGDRIEGVWSNRTTVKEALALGKFSTLRSLNLQGTAIKNEEITALLTPNGLLPLASLNLQNNYIEDEGVKAIVCLTVLTSLNLQKNYIKDEGAKTLALSNLHLLTTLNLANNYITNEGKNALNTGHLSNLTSLNLQGNFLRGKPI